MDLALITRPERAPLGPDNTLAPDDTLTPASTAETIEVTLTTRAAQARTVTLTTRARAELTLSSRLA